ncbi:DUF4342 domain-containing protein [Aliifodinibius salicampi]|uniref:DUF4342 domain-containing protein n=1 Tax=Fodinibius salicampi TaxID=1920655 RepID=A0ABT3PYI6_9BACT|nr:DUF4342 domain-containing protein [Fodinibius salicampi]MCW9712927.1 DUF4342 domain-containing protein [Fodinibius salicampi]
MKDSSSRKTINEEIQGTISEIIAQVKRLIREGNARRVLIKDKNGKVLFQSQLTVGLAGSALITIIAPIVSAISMFALLMNDIKIIVERYPEDETESTDEYEVEAEYIEIQDEEEEEGEDETGTPEMEENSTTEERTDKTVGKSNSDQ